MKPREIIRDVEKSALLPPGTGDRFAGYGVIGLPFRSGHVLALRRFPASSVGPGYTSVWHRSPSGNWTFYSTVPPEQGCARYFGAQISRNVVGPIDIVWAGPAHLHVLAGDVLHWEMKLTESLCSQLMNALTPLLPKTWWQSKTILKMMGYSARLLLGTGKMNLSGTTPNRQRFMANPKRLWLIDSSRAVVNGFDAGPVGALNQQARLRDFLIPQKGIFAVTDAFLGVSDKSVSERSSAALQASSGSRTV